MSNFISKVLYSTPYYELLLRYFYYKIIRRNAFLNSIYQKKRNIPHVDVPKVKVSIAEFKCKLKQLGIRNGDLLIVHSSGYALAGIDGRVSEIVEALIEAVGEDGTLCMPAFPQEDKLEKIDGIPVYDPENSVSWTGRLPNYFVKKKKALRSSFPCNPLAAFGKDARNVIKNNLETDLAFGDDSCWHYCYKNHAKILFLGAASSHSNTMLHVPEDIDKSIWRKNNWYENRTFFVKQKNAAMLKFEVRTRKLEWAYCVAEKYTDIQLEKLGIIRRDSLGDMHISIIDDAFLLVDSMINDKTGRLKLFWI